MASTPGTTDTPLQPSTEGRAGHPYCTTPQTVQAMYTTPTTAVQEVQYLGPITLWQGSRQHPRSQNPRQLNACMHSLLCLHKGLGSFMA